MTREIFREVDDYCRKEKSSHLWDNKNNNGKGNVAWDCDDDVDYYPNCDPSVWMRSCDEEVITPMTGEVRGVIPEWLSGTLLRNGPGSLKVGDYQFDHLFDSSALLHRFHISGGRVTYQRRFVQTDVFKRNHQARRIVLTEFGTKSVPDPCQTIFQRIAAVFNPDSGLSDNSMISVYPFGDQYYTFAEAPFIHRIDVETLETKDRICISDYVGVVNHTSHPHVTDDGTVYNVGLSITAMGPAYSVVCFPSVPSDTGRNSGGKAMFEGASIVASLPARWKLNPSYMHTFGITENYFIIIEQPLAVSMTLIHVLSRATGALERTFTAAALFYLHIINQYESEKGDSIVIDICCYRNAKMLDCMYVDAMRNMHKNPDYSKLFRARPLRFVLPMTDKFADVKPNRRTNIFEMKASAHRRGDGAISVEPELICNLGCETPRHNQKYLGRQYRYFYAISSDVDIQNPGTIIKVDTLNKSSLTWSEDGLYPSEPIFVAQPESQNEDDGIILSAAIYGEGRECDVCLLILDAKSMIEMGRVTFHTPGAVPKCLHGWFTLETPPIDENNDNNNDNNI
ncbi:carotenoid isomerooxygenase isoform X2 [Diachasma alloeum]|uniref:carotenoid isomerooxygenase isoform X2 n=1 Tax=Diachasma alloeum TaxID=454923 RepID=UPI0007384988|nr:carotenoid isomerooxygenase isoform X2 [Diachasma alloeum]